MATQHDGIDPIEAEILVHPRLNRRFVGTADAVDLPERYYDTALAYNVAEHVVDGGPFFAAVGRALRPGGDFWLLTPHSRHPFAVLSNTVRLLNFKALYRKSFRVNSYASYYRINSPKAIVRRLEPDTWARADFWYIPCTKWDGYFPRILRFIPHTYDRLIAGRNGPAMLLLAARLTKSIASAPDAHHSIPSHLLDSRHREGVASAKNN
jgi:SAM-dependent methyltransferase